MGGKILRRCDECKGFHASYLVIDPQTGKKEILCQNCWKKRFGQGKVEKAVDGPPDPGPARPGPERE